ncbi:hypothetical protein [Flavobacterium yafengii]|uniref:hypothetical protein n=1 Tax=Flavobacterium yafengii TaxID=3041253 RepID=UPI0024A8CD2F|nr:hypothetical protein [Flavobacterium yafengii]MDI6047047.1 hypothetical protein [Flavobacterium yafengii]
MPNTNDILITTLRKAHLEWGSHRHTTSRGTVYGEGYLQIPIAKARLLNITNSNLNGGNITYVCNSSDGFLNNVELKATGSMASGNIYAKQFQGSGNLKVLGDWFSLVNAVIGDKVEIKWTSPTQIILTKL